MAVVCVVDRDEKSMNEIISFIKNSELDVETHSYTSLESLVAATHLFDLSAKNQTVIGKIDVLILDYEACGKVEEDLKKIKRGLEIQQLQNEFPTRIILTSFEGIKVPIANLKVDDYIFRPLEKQLFLQKLQIAVAAPEKVDPSYLALQPIKEKIEVGKRSTLAFFNEFCLTIKNPGPLSEGAFVRFYSKRFGNNKLDKIVGRSLESNKGTDGFLCRFDYFGLSHDKQSILRKRFAELSKEMKEPLTIPYQPLDHKAQVVIIDLDKQESQSIKQFLEENVDINVLHFPSYTNFLASCFPAEPSKKEAEVQIVTKPAMPAVFPFHIEVNAEFEMQTLGWESDLADSAFLTYPKADWEKRLDLFVKSIEPGQLSDFKDLVFMASSTGAKQHGKFIFNHSDAAKSLLAIEIEKVKESFKITVHDKTEEEKTYDYKNLGISKINLSHMDLLIIDENYVLDAAVWLEGLTNKAQLLANKQMPRIVVIGKSPNAPAKFIRKEFSDYMQKPLDKPLLGKKLLTSYRLGITELKMIQITVKQLAHAKLDEEIMLATEIDMLSLSEFGIAVRFGSPIRQDMFIQFYLKSFLGMDDHEPIYARCYYSEEDREFVGKYICYFTFLGVNDEVFTRIRLWMKDYYIKTKDASE
jgi:hypothetical protein